MRTHPFSPRSILAVALFSAFMLASCATNPVTGKHELHLVNTAQEIEIGEHNYVPTRQSEGGDYLTYPSLNAYVERVGMKLARASDRPDLPYEFVVLDNPVPNAWALPGGKIAVNRGLLTELNSEAELAAVLGHEIVHAAARHAARQMEQGRLLNVGMAGLGAALGNRTGTRLAKGAAKFGSRLIHSRYGRDNELESDRYGMLYMARAGYDPQAAVTLQETFVRLFEGRKSSWVSGLFATHPPSRERVEANRARVLELNSGGVLGTEEYVRAMADLTAEAPAFALQEAGEKALAEGDPERAIAKARSAIDMAPQEAAFHGLEGRALMARAKLKRQDRPQASERDTHAHSDADAERAAEAALSRAIQRNNGYFLYPLLRGIVRRDLDDGAAARTDLEASLLLLPTGRAHVELGELDRDAGRTDAAIAHFEAAVGDSPSGRRAIAGLVALQPAKYLTVEAAVSAPRLALRVTNRAPITVRDVTVDYVIGGDVSGGNVRGQIVLPDGLAAGESIRLERHVSGLLRLFPYRVTATVSHAKAVLGASP